MKNIDILKKANIDVDSGIELLGDIEMYNETLQDFLDESVDRMKRIETSYNSEDMASYTIDVHAMKGDSNYLGFTKLAELSLEHQLKAQDNNLDYVKENYNDLIKEANRIIDTVKKYLTS